MATLIEFEIPATQFPLSETLSRVPTADFEIDWIGTDIPYITVYLVVHTDDFETLEAAFEADPTVNSVTLLLETEDDRSYRIEWTESIRLLIHIMTDQQGIITHATGNKETWTLRVLFPEREALSRANEYAQKQGFSLDLQRAYQVDDSQHGQKRVTGSQYDLLVSAFESGYFKVPGETTMSEFAAQEGVSHQAVSEQLRRAVHNLIRQSLIAGPGENTGGASGLTQDQHETLVTAFEAGYFKVPREATLKEISEQYDVSHQALSERLRRGIGTLIQQALLSER